MKPSTYITRVNSLFESLYDEVEKRNAIEESLTDDQKELPEWENYQAITDHLHAMQWDLEPVVERAKEFKEFLN